MKLKVIRNRFPWLSELFAEGRIFVTAGMSHLARHLIRLAAVPQATFPIGEGLL